MIVDSLALIKRGYFLYTWLMLHIFLYIIGLLSNNVVCYSARFSLL